MSTGEELKLGKFGRQGRVNTDSIKGGFRKEAAEKAGFGNIFAALDDGNGVLTDDEINALKQGITESAEHGKDSIFSQKEAEKYIQNFNQQAEANKKTMLSDVDAKKLFDFLKFVEQQTKSVISSTVDEDNNAVTKYKNEQGEEVTETFNKDTKLTEQVIVANGKEIRNLLKEDGKKISSTTVEGYIGQIDDCTITTLFEDDGETVKSIIVTDSRERVISKTEGNQTTETTYNDETGEVYEKIIIDGKLTKTTVKDPANKKTTVIEYDSATDEDGALLQKTRTETVGDETKTWAFENGKKTTLSVKKGAITKNYVYDEAGTTADLKSIDTDKGNGIVEHLEYSQQNGKDIATVSIDGKNQSQTLFGADGKGIRTIQYTDAPNGERATAIVIQDQESINSICSKFGMTQEEFRAFNAGNKKGLAGSVGATVNVRGELDVTDSRFDGRLSSKDAIKARDKRIYREKVSAAKGVANQRKVVVMLVSEGKKYNGDWKNVARDLYQQEGNTQYSEIDLQVRTQQLQKLNPDVKKFVYGSTVIRVAIDPATVESNDTVRKLQDGSDATTNIQFDGDIPHAWNIALYACRQLENNVARPLSPVQQGIRAQKIIELNPGVFDKSGKLIKPPVGGKIRIPVGYTMNYIQKQQQRKAKIENQYYAASSQIYQTADRLTGEQSISRITTQLGSINEDHIVQFYESYNTFLEKGRQHDNSWAQSHGASKLNDYSGHHLITSAGTKDTSIYDTICSETGASKDSRKSLCSNIFERIVKAAEKAGVSPDDIKTARDNFTTSRDNEFDRSGVVNTTKMEQASSWLISKIHEAKTQAPEMDNATAQQAFTDMYQQQVDGAQASFDQNMEHVTWVGTFSAWLADKFSTNTTVGQMEEKLGLAKGALNRLKNCKSEEEFKKTYKDIFEVDFNAKNIATVMKYQENLQTIANDEAQIQAIKDSYNTASSKNTLSDLEAWVTAGITDADEKADILETIYAQFGGLDDISQLSEAAKRNAIRKAKDAEIAAIQAEINGIKGSQTVEQMYEDMSILAEGAFGPNNNIAKEVEKFNGNINTAEMVGTIVTEIGATFIPVGRVLNLAGKGIRLANGAYKAYRTGKAIKTTTSVVRATNATARTGQVIADAAATETTMATRFVDKAKTTVKAISNDPVTRQAAQAGFNTGALDYTKHGDLGHALGHGIETAIMFEVGGYSSKFSQAVSRDLEITSAAGRWGLEAGITGTADLSAAYIDTKLVHGQDLTTADGMMNFGMDAAFALLAIRGTRVKANHSHTNTQTNSNPSVLETATNHGTTASGGKFGADKQKKAIEEAKTVSPDAAPEMYHQATQHTATNRQQGHALQNDVLKRMGIRKEGKKLIADTPQGQEVVRRVNEQFEKDASAIFSAREGGEIAPHDAATLDAHLANNCNTKEEVEKFINDLKKLVGTDTNGKLLSYKSADGVDRGAFLLQNAERKLKSLGDFEDAMRTITSEGGMGDLATVRAFMGKPEATTEQLKAILDAMQANPAIKKSQGARKLMADLQKQIEVRKQAAIEESVITDSAPEEPDVVRHEAEPEPVEIKNEPDPVVVRDEADPVVIKDEADPVVIKDEPDPVVIRDEADPVVVKDEPDFVEIKNGSEPEVVILSEAELKHNHAIAQENKINQLEAQHTKISARINIDGKPQNVTIYKGSQSGSNPGYWVKNNSTGELHYVEFPKEGMIMERNPKLYDCAEIKEIDPNQLSREIEASLYGQGAHAHQEALSADLYRAAGFESPEISVVNANGEIGTSSKYLSGLEAPKPTDVAAVREGFATDCWLANWDACKDGNVMMMNGKAIRTEVGGSLCYRARGQRKGGAFGENVDELTSFFGPKSLSKKYLEGMTRDELMNSLKHVTGISDETIKGIVRNAEKNGMKQANFMEEMLIERRDYIRRFEQTCENNPINPGETIEQYVNRMAKMTPKTTYNIGGKSFDDIPISSRIYGDMNDMPSIVLETTNKTVKMSEHLTPSQKRMIEESYQAFETSKGKHIQHNADNVLTSDNLLHATNADYLEGILNDGLMSREYSGKVGARRQDGSDPGSMTPLCSDLWDIQGSQTIGEYFDMRSSHWKNHGESNFLPTPLGGSDVVVVFDKKCADPRLIDNSFSVSDRNSIMFQDNNMGGYATYKTHRAVPVGLPSNTIDRIIVRANGYTDPQSVINIVRKSGKQIKVYDTEGHLLFDPATAPASYRSRVARALGF